jgi:hypothetical protein
LPLAAHLAGDPRHLRGEGVELIDHRVDRRLQLENLAADVDRDLLRQVAVRDGRRDLRDVADLRRQVRGHGVDGVGQVLPGAGDALDRCLAAELALGAHLGRDAGHLRGEGVELLDHRVDDLRGPPQLAAQGPAIDLEAELLAEVAAGDGVQDAGDLAGRRRDVVDELVDRPNLAPPIALESLDRRALVDPPGLADDPPDAPQLELGPVVQLDEVVERLGDVRDRARLVGREADAEVAAPDGAQRLEKLAVERLARRNEIIDGLEAGHAVGDDHLGCWLLAGSG